MYMINTYLKETPLTSTKNKFVEDSPHVNDLKEFGLGRSKGVQVYKRKLERELFSFDKCCTENKFLTEQDDFPKKKKKKFRKRAYCKARAYCEEDYSPERCYSEVGDPQIAKEISCDELDLSCQLPTEEIAVFGSCPLPSAPFNFSTAPSYSSSNAFTFGTAMVRKSAPAFAFGGPIALASGKAMPRSKAVSQLQSQPQSAEMGVLFGNVVLDPIISETVILKMPTYELNVVKLYEETEYEIFSSCPDDISSLQDNFANPKAKKMQLLNVVSKALMYSSNLKDNKDPYRIILLKSADAVRLIDPEFILKVALYARQELQIRTVTNFLLSYSAVHQNTRIYLERYFNASIVLPTDWIQVAEYYQILSSEVQKQPFSSALRRIMKRTFQKFDKYQLAKYNRDRIKKKENKKKGIAECDSEENRKEEILKKLTLKQLIRRFHIDSPAEHVMCILGKKYPNSHEEFNRYGLPGTWDCTKAGMRMKLPVPETWETQISANGNKPHVWESLIDDNKLPYMAMLRNLRNLILSGISSVHHTKVINYLENKKSVINSRQLPMQFYEAFKVITNLQNMLEESDAVSSENFNMQKLPAWKKNQLKKTNERIKNASASVLEQYKSAITKALEISSLNNLHPIPGKTLVICQIDAKQLSTAKVKSYETCIMMGLMCLKACEDCKMNILSYSELPDTISLSENAKFFDVLMTTCERYQKLFSDQRMFDQDGSCVPVSCLENVLDYYLKPHTLLSLKLDHIVFLQTSCCFESVMSSFLHKYRQIVNPDLLYTNVNFSLSNNSFSEDSSDKDVYLCGSGSSLIKFIAQRSSGGQLTYVENIDMKYNLEPCDLKKYSSNFSNGDHESEQIDSSERAIYVPLNYRVPKWHTVRIFISSTFKDMMSERDLLVRYVFPELRRRAASVFTRIVEIDLRWGITEADSSTKRAAELCLSEAQKADLFVGLIGERYGTIYNFEPPDASDLQWVKNCPTGLSITELEMYAAALRKPQLSQKKAFFYLRDNSFLRYVPGKWANHFTSEDLESKLKVDALKAKIRSFNFSLLDGYPCHWAGIFENKPVLAGLDILGNRVLEDLWKAIQEIHETDPYCDSINEEEMYQQNLIESQNFFVGKNSSIDVIHKIQSEQGIFVICGAAGSGKTTFAIKLLQSLKKHTVVKFFIGISPRSRDLSYMLQYICKCICHHLGISIPIPNLPIDIVNQFPDFLLEASNCCGGKDLILVIDGLDHLENGDQQLDWLPLFLPNKVKLVCTVSISSVAFKVLCERQEHGNDIFIQELPVLLQSDRETFVRNYLSYYRKTLDESAFNNNMLKIVTKKDSCNPCYLRIVCDFLRIYASFENLVSILQKLPSSIVLLFQEIILQMENEFGSVLVQTVLTLLCITKEGLEDNDLHYVLSFIIHFKELKTAPPFRELKEKIVLLEPENLLCQVKYCSLVYLISTFAYGQLRQKSFSLVGTEFENAVKKFYLNKNFISYSKIVHSILAAYYYNMCDVNNDGRYRGQSGFAFRSVLYHMFNGNLYKELSDLLCNHKFIESVFRTKSDDQLLEYYSSILYEVLPRNQNISREIDHYHLFSFYDFVSRNFHIFHQHPQLVMQQALNEPSDNVVNLKNEAYNHSVENLSRSYMLDYRLATLCGFVKNITASAGEKLKSVVILGSEDGYLKVLDLSTRRVVRTIKGHVSAITCICCVGRNRICASSVDGTLSLWNSDDFSRIAVLNGHRHNVTSCCSDPDGSILFSSGWDNSVRLWSLNDGRSISVIDNFRCPVNCIDHHPVKQQIACGLWNGNIEVWDTVSMKKKLVFSNCNGSVKSLAYTPDGVNIISSFIQSEISIWSSEEGLKISSLKGHILPVKALTYSFDDNIFVSGSDDCTLKVWSAVHGSHFSTIAESKFCPVSLMEFMTENLLAVAFQNSEIWVIDVNSGNVISTATLLSDTVSTFSKYSFINVRYQKLENDWYEKSLVFGTRIGKLMIEDLLSSSFATKAEMDSKITAVIHNCDVILCGTAEGDIGVFSHPDNKLSKILYAAHKGFLSTFCFSVELGELFALSAANDNILKLWNIEWKNCDVTLQEDFFNKHKDSITCSLFYPQPCNTSTLRNFLTGSHDNNIISWNKSSVKVFQGLRSSVLNVAYFGDYILGCGNDGAIVMWSENGTILTSIPKIELSSTTLTFFVAEDESDKFSVTLAYVDQDGSIKIKKPLQRTYCCSFDGHSKPITSCCTTENGEVISCSLDGSVSLWKVPLDIPDSYFMHLSAVTALILSSSLEFALSSDAQGNIILWKTHFETSALPLTYAGKKSYSGGFIRALSWMKSNYFVCAVCQLTGSQETYFLNIIHFLCSPVTQTPVFSFQVKKSYNFESEVLCLDSCSDTDAVIVGLKSGDVMVITSETQRLINMSNDWLLGVRFFTREKSSDFFCASFIDGSVKLFSISDFLNSEYTSPSPFAVYKPTDTYQGSKFTSSMCCGEGKLVCCGDSEGFLRIYSQHALKFIEKVHNDSISGMCIIGSYLFTSSLDKTVKGWNLISWKQVCQFHSHAPVSCIASPQTSVDLSKPDSYLLFIGTTSGNVHLLKFHCK